MGVWSCFLELLQAGLFTATQLGGGSLGWGILVFSLALRLALLPLTYSLARRARARQLRMNQLEPRLERLRKRHRGDPARLFQETARLYGRHGMSMVDGRSFFGAVIQLPFFAGMYTVIRRALASGTGGPFLWIDNIARADVLLAVLVSALTYAATVLNPSVAHQAPHWFSIVSAAVTLLILVRLSAGLGVYWAASSVVSGFQAVMVRRSRIS
jgi:YidC/Oxa1 family membrane protein insertase